MDVSRERADGPDADVAPAAADAPDQRPRSTLQGLHIAAQSCWFVLLAIMGIAMIVSAGDECDGLDCLFEDRTFTTGVVIIGGVQLWVGGAIVIALVSLAIGWVVRRLRGRSRSDAAT